MSKIMNCDCGRALAAHEERGLDVERLDLVVTELRERGYTIPEASTIASTYARLATPEAAPISDQ